MSSNKLSLLILLLEKRLKKNKKTNEHQGRKELKDLKVFNLAENQQKLIEETYKNISKTKIFRK